VSDASTQVPVLRVDADEVLPCDDHVAREEPLEIRLGGVSLAVVMRTPGHDHELTRGFLVTERVVDGPEGVESVRHCGRAGEPGAEDNVIQAVLAPGVDVDLDRLRRCLLSRGQRPRSARRRRRGQQHPRLQEHRDLARQAGVNATGSDRPGATVGAPRLRRPGRPPWSRGPRSG
jgi:formate dehydrogenase assembly factor FdhD